MQSGEKVVTLATFNMGPVTHIHIKGAREHNLKNLELKIPRGKLLVVTGPSGSGKSSLAFDTIYAEGYRKYMESLSTQARQILEQLKHPDVDFIQGLSPVLAIEQRAGGEAPRNTVATATEIADYARLLWSLHGKQYCPKDGGRVLQRSLDDNVEHVILKGKGRRIMILAPLMKDKPAAIKKELPRLRQRGFQRIRLNGGAVKNLDEDGLVPMGEEEVSLDLVVDRLLAEKDQRSRLADSLELAFKEGKDRAIVLIETSNGGWMELSLSQKLACEICGDIFEKLTPRSFSHNHSDGACFCCGGLGQVRKFMPELLVPDPGKSINEGAIKAWKIGGKTLIIRHNSIIRQLAEQLSIDLDLPWKDFPEEIRNLILFGGGNRLFSFKKRRTRKVLQETFPGVIADLEKSFRETDSESFRARLMTYMVAGVCPECEGSRLNARSRAVRLAVGDTELALPDFFAMDVYRAHASAVEMVKALSGHHALEDVVSGIELRLRFLKEVGLGYLSLDREYDTLSGGEAQRVRLATQLGMGLTGVIYVLDEPSIGLHQHDNEKLLALLQELRDRGNTVLVVEHDEETMRLADELIELGPGAGKSGGYLLYQGTPADLVRLHPENSVTAPYLSRKLRIEKNAGPVSPGPEFLIVEGAEEHNLRGVDVRFPLGALTCVTGVSGSGKSTLINDVLSNAAGRKLNRAKLIPGKHRRITGLEHFEKLIRVDQTPIGRSPRSNPATYIGLFELLRDLYAKVPLAKVRGYKPSRFSFNVRGGRCERCQGDGQIKLDMQFMADAYVPCPSCGGRRYNRETLDVLFRGKSIADVLEMSVSEAMDLFKNIPRVMEKLNTLNAVGLGYLSLGQSAVTLSGGEAQRVKLSLELSKRQKGNALYILDEPTTGLHWKDIQQLMDLLFKLRDMGNTLIIIEHNLDVINLADWIVDLGPGGGNEGGCLVYEGPRDKFEKLSRGATAESLKKWKNTVS